MAEASPNPPDMSPATCRTTSSPAPSFTKSICSTSLTIACLPQSDSKRTPMSARRSPCSVRRSDSVLQSRPTDLYTLLARHVQLDDPPPSLHPLQHLSQYARPLRLPRARYDPSMRVRRELARELEPDSPCCGGEEVGRVHAWCERLEVMRRRVDGGTTAWRKGAASAGRRQREEEQGRESQLTGQNYAPRRTAGEKRARTGRGRYRTKPAFVCAGRRGG